MAGNNAAEGRVYGTAAVYVAPVGTAAPTDITTALNAAFIHTGLTVEDGLTWSTTRNTFEVRSHQSFYTTKRGMTGVDLTVGFVMQQQNAANWKLYHGGGTFAVAGGVSTFTPATPGPLDYRAMVVQGEDDSGFEFRLHIPKGLVTETQDIPIVKDNTSNLGVTFAATPTGVGVPWAYITDDVTAFPAG